MAEMHLACVEAVGLNGAVGVSCEVAVTQQAEGDDLSRGVCERRPDIRRLAVVFDEGHNVGAIWQHQKPLLQPHEQVIDLPGFVLGFILLDFANGKSVQFAVVAEQNSVAAVSHLQRCRDADPPQRHSNVRQITLPELYHAVEKRQRARGADSP